MAIADIIGLTRKITRPRTEKFLRHYSNDGAVLDIGCGNDEYKHLFPNRKTLELNPRGDVDYVGNAEDMRDIIGDNSFDCVLLMGVLEHIEDPHKAIAEIHRILKPGGLLLFASPFVYPIHDYPGDYWRFTENGIRILFRDFEIETIEEQASTIETLAIIFQRIGFQCDTLGFRPFKAFWFVLAKITLLFRHVLTKQYGDIGHTEPVPNILVSGYHVALRKVSSTTPSTHEL